MFPPPSQDLPILAYHFQQLFFRTPSPLVLAVPAAQWHIQTSLAVVFLLRNPQFQAAV